MQMELIRYLYGMTEAISVQRRFLAVDRGQSFAKRHFVLFQVTKTVILVGKQGGTWNGTTMFLYLRRRLTYGTQEQEAQTSE